MRNAKIVCTLGPASASREAVRDLASAGMSVARVNASHGTPADRRDLVRTVRAVDGTTDAPLASMLDTRGPEVRTAALDEPIRLETGATVEFVAGETATPERVGLTSAVDAADLGDSILLDDGRIETRVEAVSDGVVTAVVESGGDLRGRAGVNVPGVDLGLDPITEADRADLRLAVEEDVDFVAASFVGSAADVYAVSAVVEAFGADLPIVAKIERADALANLDEIVEAAYGVMVARGDLGVECPMEDVPIVQKRVVRTCRAAGTPVITATEMLDSMVHARRPTRAEASDVANAVLDGTDAVMLSAETAVGDHPTRVVEAMDRIVREAEASEEYAELREQRVPEAGEARTDALVRSARYLARDVGATAVVVASESGYTARKAAKFRPGVPVVATTPSEDVRRHLALSCGVAPEYAEYGTNGASAVVERAVAAALGTDLVASGDTVVVVSGMMTELEGSDTTNTLKLHVAAETVAAGRSVVAGRAIGPVYRVGDGDLEDVPEGAVAVLPASFEGEFGSAAERLAAVVSAESGLTGYAAVIARELGIPMVGDATLDPGVADGDVVTVDGERGVVYAGRITGRRD